MPTLPSERQPHRHRQAAESFGVDVERYDRTRPAYPPELIDHLVAAAPGRETLDIGIGTGIDARQFQAAGCRVLGVEPDPRMAEFARLSGIDVEVGTFEAWEPAGRRFDLLVSGQAWHWVDPVAGAVKAAEVLRPGGLWAVFWHVPEPPSQVGDALMDAYRRHVPDAPDALKNVPKQSSEVYGRLITKITDGLREAGAFGEPEQRRYDWEKEYTRDEWLDQLPTFGSLTWVEPAPRNEILAEVGAVIDGMGGRFTTRYTTMAIIAVRT
ncbi:class I SAM-dependent methyltransferase [Amycolatopsis regifaucium]|uniref:SAM-dependent methyltransferase n=1 Tax=Amycolatopsis regifaucium TaxID=546365 RepID=A0ABX3DK78_9PSEU|nr:class I SAM-dependent methyltransferase [Amycolatopsis regifaucium]OKA04928.1 SAM-dependent methyltransferase [Amycolatopsis regifaucium]SFH75425.1 SAM-dependent methyltransferase [Amycolatopsis regifaucium]